MKLVTIGVFGFSESAYFEALQRANVDTFCDVRARRAVRGAHYKFVNSKRLQARLRELGIRYLHFRELAPSEEVRKRQKEADKAAGVARRERDALNESFVEGYREQCLRHFESKRFIESLGPEAQVVALFCVERQPAACHRGLLAEQLHKDAGMAVEHLIP